MIIAISGKARSGKTEAAKAIAMANPNFYMLSFAKPLKRMAMDQFGLTEEDIEDKKRVITLGGKDITVRSLLIEIGLMYRRIDPDFWVKKLWNEAESCITFDRDIVIDDMRFKNEFYFLKAKGATTIRVERPGIELIDDPSEKDLDEEIFDLSILNDGTLDDHHANARMALYTLKKEAPLP